MKSIESINDPWFGRSKGKPSGSAKEIRICNFRSIENVCIDVTDLNLLFGTNGSGKTNFMRALMFAAANLSPNPNFAQTVFKFKNGVDLGSFEQIVANGKTDESICIGIRFVGKFKFPSLDVFRNSDLHTLEKLLSNQSDEKSKQEYPFDCEMSFKFETDRLNRNLYEIEIYDRIRNLSFAFRRNIKTSVSEIDKEHWGLEGFDDDMLLEDFDFAEDVFNFDLADGSKLEFYNLNFDYIEFGTKPFERLSYSWRYDIHSFENHIRSHCKISQIKNDEIILFNDYEIEESNLNYVFYDLHRFAFLANVVLPKCLNELLNFAHMPTTREIPNRSYIMSGNTFDNNQYYGILRSLHEDSLNDASSGRFRPIEKSLESFGFDYNLEFIINEDIGKLHLSHAGKWLNISNMSSGFIQLFPIIMFCKWPPLMESFRTLLIEQPELHLHPKLQSQLAVLFSSVPRMLFIETHSEHLIRKLQVLIAKGELAREKVGVWYFKKVDGITKVEKMEIDENGLFKNDWPDGFFDDSIDLTMELFEALRKRNN